MASPQREPEARKQRFELTVCKPCWELKYCPYGPLVEYFPIVGPNVPDKEIGDVEARYHHLIDQLAKGAITTEDDILEAAARLEYLCPSRWHLVRQFQMSDLACNVWGHICPVFFMAEGCTETKEGRRKGRHIPRDVMLQVVRRDGHICQICHQPVPDNEVQFDHLIPFSKGGPMTADNIRLVHKKCNLKKSDSLKELLWERPSPKPTIKKKGQTGSKRESK